MLLEFSVNILSISIQNNCLDYNYEVLKFYYTICFSFSEKEIKETLLTTWQQTKASDMEVNPEVVAGFSSWYTLCVSSQHTVPLWSHLFTTLLWFCRLYQLTQNSPVSYNSTTELWMRPLLIQALFLLGQYRSKWREGTRPCVSSSLHPAWGKVSTPV